MIETQPSYDIRRNLAGHRFNYRERLKTDGAPEGDCTLCGAVYCMFNITAKKVLAALENGIPGKSVKQFSCDDKEDDPVALANDLRHID